MDQEYTPIISAEERAARRRQRAEARRRKQRARRSGSCGAFCPVCCW